MTTLRDYQQIIYDEIPRRLVKGPVLVQSPARSGKSKIIAATAERIIKARRIPLVLTHRGKIQRQLIDHCRGVSIDAKTDHVFIAATHCYVAMNQTLIKRPFILSQLQALGDNLVIITDEAHRGDFNKTFDQLPDALRIGFTATPAYKWAKFLPTYYNSLIHGLQPKELIDRGYITPIDYYEMRNDLSTLVKGATGDYTEQSQDNIFNQSTLYDGLFEQLPRFKFKKCIVFCASKKAADKLAAEFITNGYSTSLYYSGLKDGSYQLAQFTELNQTIILVTVSALSEGFDYSGIDMNVIWRATTSLPLFIQMAMRGATPETDGSKHRTTVLDFGGNNSRFGGHASTVALTMDRDWNALWQPPEVPPRLSNGVAAIKNCPACDFIIPALARSCSNCGYIYPDSDVRLKEGELVKIEEGLNAVRSRAEALKGRRISSLTADELALYAKQNNKKPFAMRVARAKGVTDSTFLYEYAAAIGYSPKWADRELRNTAEIQAYEPNYRIDFSDILIK